MSTADKPDPARVWQLAEKLLAEEDDERLLKLTPEERRAELERRGVKPATEWSVDEMVAGAAAHATRQAAPASPATRAASPPAPREPAPPAPKLAPVVPIRRPWKVVALSAAACVALFLIVKASQGPDPVATAPTKRDIAEAYRDMAEARCALKDWARCKWGLDEAAMLDPAGESEPRVQKARAEIAVGVAGHPADGGPGP